jgi:hypothetical protein
VILPSPKPAFLALALWLSALGLCVLSGNGYAGQINLPTHTIYYSAFPSRLIPTDVAEAHRLRRADELMLVNITVQKMNEPAEATISGEVINLLGQIQTLRFVPIKEAQALYYLSEVIVDERDWLRFKIRIEIDPELDPYEFEFERRFY